MARRTDFRCISCGDFISVEGLKRCYACMNPKTKKAAIKIRRIMKENSTYKGVQCRCRLARTHPDCSVCGTGTHKVCGVCRENDHEGPVILGTWAVTCKLHKVKK